MAATELFEAMYTIRALRRLKPKPIPDDLIIRGVQQCAPRRLISAGFGISIMMRGEACRRRLGAIDCKASDEVAMRLAGLSNSLSHRSHLRSEGWPP